MSIKYTIILIYDIPNNNIKESKDYNKFRKHILSIGFMMLQESVYIKSLNQKPSYLNLKSQLKLSSPNNSNIRMLLIPNNQYEKMEVIAGDKSLSEKIISRKTRLIEF